MIQKTIKLTVLIALLIAGSFTLLAQNDGSTLSSANHPVSSSTAFAIDKNIISFDVDNLVDKIIYEYAPYPNYGGIPEAWSPHYWTITLIMAEGTDVTSLAPRITLAPSVAVYSKHADVQDFSQQVEYNLICEDGSTVTYLLSAYTQDNTREQGWIVINCSPNTSAGWTNPLPGSHNYDDQYSFYCTAYPEPGYSFVK